ncbi:hypothetical protein RFI_13494 [Reticulomyxa filosa]|uniref:Uncharacterized protein n=1 Tax=Reticulomyxa filosa TaxID=46433 RepID=X6ND29_RETFI|nr:hypothetical protein RFI_13494 [Reticulomyxa filosa]|eukprot:ETO23679.1 hypothetical protein RFI_13494 [Reticulomyxa filosa]
MIERKTTIKAPSEAMERVDSKSLNESSTKTEKSEETKSKAKKGESNAETTAAMAAVAATTTAGNMEEDAENKKRQMKAPRTMSAPAKPLPAQPKVRGIIRNEQVLNKASVSDVPKKQQTTIVFLPKQKDKEKEKEEKEIQTNELSKKQLRKQIVEPQSDGRTVKIIRYYEMNESIYRQNGVHELKTVYTTETIWKEYPDGVPSDLHQRLLNKRINPLREPSERQTVVIENEVVPVVTEEEIGELGDNLLDQIKEYRKIMLQSQRAPDLTDHHSQNTSPSNSNIAAVTSDETMQQQAHSDHNDISSDEFLHASNTRRTRSTTITVTAEMQDQLLLKNINVKAVQNLELLDMITRYSLLSSITVVTAAIWGTIAIATVYCSTIVSMESLFFTVSGFDAVINVFCIFFMYAFAKKWYRMLCMCGHTFYEKQCVKYAEKEILQKQKEELRRIQQSDERKTH